MREKTDFFKRTRSLAELRQSNPVAGTLFIVILLIGVAASVLTGQFARNQAPIWMLLALVVGMYFLFALKIANQWERTIVLRFGKFSRLAGPGLFWIVPIMETTPTWVDQRVMVTPFKAERTLTRDTVPVDVDAVLFWVVWDAQKAALEVENYRDAIAWAAQTALRDIIGKMMLAEFWSGVKRLMWNCRRSLTSAQRPGA